MSTLDNPALIRVKPPLWEGPVDPCSEPSQGGGGGGGVLCFSLRPRPEGINLQGFLFVLSLEGMNSQVSSSVHWIPGPDAMSYN